jgi:hypothetical protein
MTTSSPAYGIASTRNSIPSTDPADTTDTTGSAPTGTGTPVLAAAPYRASSMLQQALEAGNAGQQKTPPLSSQPALAQRRRHASILHARQAQAHRLACEHRQGKRQRA